MQHTKEKSELINNKSNLTVNLIALTNLTSGCQKKEKTTRFIKVGGKTITHRQKKRGNKISLTGFLTISHKSIIRVFESRFFPINHPHHGFAYFD